MRIRRAARATFIPPSTTISTPVTYELSSEARNKATFATSSGRPRRPNGVAPDDSSEYAHKAYI